jgi:peptide/nickel transport system substrate-binding protein
MATPSSARSHAPDRHIAVVSVAVFAASATETAAAAQPRTGGTLKLFYPVDPPTMDPAQLREASQVTPAIAQTAIFDELVYTDPVTLNVVPKIATSLTTPDKGLTWTLKLRPNVKFSDGTA